MRPCRALLVSGPASNYLFLSISLLAKIRSTLVAAGWRKDTPLLVIHKASWHGEERIVRGTLADIRDKRRAARFGTKR